MYSSIIKSRRKPSNSNFISYFSPKIKKDSNFNKSKICSEYRISNIIYIYIYAS